MTNNHLWFWYIMLPKSSPLQGAEGPETAAENQQNSTDVQNQEMGPAAVSVAQQEHHEREPSPSSEELSPQDPSYQSAEEEPGTPGRAGCGGSGQSRTTVALTALSNHLSEDEVGLSDLSTTVQDVSTDHLSDLNHVQQTLEEKSDESPETVGSADTECITKEGNADVSVPSATAADAGSAEEWEDIQSSQETELSDETDVCVHQGI